MESANKADSFLSMFFNILRSSIIFLLRKELAALGLSSWEGMSFAGLLAKDTGAISVFEYDIDKEPQKIKQILNVVPGFSHVNSSLSVDEFLKVYAHLYNVKDWQKERESVLKRVELKDKRSTQLNELSSGYKQRALLAKALLSKPKLL